MCFILYPSVLKVCIGLYTVYDISTYIYSTHDFFDVLYTYVYTGVPTEIAPQNGVPTTNVTKSHKTRRK